MTASDHLKQRTGSLGGDQDELQLPEDIKVWHGYVTNSDNTSFEVKKSLLLSWLNRIAKAEAALAQKTRECEEIAGERDRQYEFNAGQIVKVAELEAQVEQLGRQVAELTTKPVFTYDEIDELCCEWGEPRYLQTDDGEAWFWKFEGADLPVADNLAELLLAARQLLASRARTK